MFESPEKGTVMPYLKMCGKNKIKQNWMSLFLNDSCQKHNHKIYCLDTHTTFHQHIKCFHYLLYKIISI